MLFDNTFCEAQILFLRGLSSVVLLSFDLELYNLYDYLTNFY